MSADLHKLPSLTPLQNARHRYLAAKAAALNSEYKIEDGDEAAELHIEIDEVDPDVAYANAVDKTTAVVGGWQRPDLDDDLYQRSVDAINSPGFLPR